jgi:cation:H+ antiporter
MARSPVNASAISHLLFGLAALVFGAQLLVRGASRLALGLGISPLVVGLTVVAFGTSAPELAVSAKSSLAGQGELVLGNVVGSNIYNVLFILGFCSVISPLSVAPQLIRFDVPIMIGASALVFMLSLAGSLSSFAGVILISGIVAYTAFVVRNAREESLSAKLEYTHELTESVKPDRRFWRHVAAVTGGLVLLTLGSDWLVDGAISIARHFQLGETLIGMTMVTIGTTAPELSAPIAGDQARG